MPINITMPALSPTMEEGTLAKWNVKPGDTVEAGDVIAEIETDKATMEVEAVDEGTVAQILVEAGTEGVQVNALIAVLAEEGEDASSIKVDADTPASKAEPAPEPVAAKTPAPPDEDPTPASDKQLASTPVELPSAGKGDTRIKASPLARRVAALKGIDLSALKGKGSGPRGRIIKKDVEAYTPGTDMVPAAKTAGSSLPPDGLILPTELDDRVYDPEGYDLVPLTGMQKTVAKRLTQSFMQIPHFPLTVDIGLDKLLSARKAINDAAPEGVKISVNDMLIKASAMALMSVPECNASYTDKGFAYHKSANISVAVAIDGGLITPVVRHAQTKGLAEIAAEMKDLATRAREKKLAPQEYMGGTFSISNLGMFGIKGFASIINPPEGMIMSVGAGTKQPVVKDDGTIGAATLMTVTLTCDHRVIGGAEGAKWINVFKGFVESPESMLL